MSMVKIKYLPVVAEEASAEMSIFANRWFNEGYANNALKEFIVVIPGFDDGQGVAWDMEDARWREVYDASCRIKSNQPTGHLWSWRVIYEHGEDIAPGLGVFRYRGDPSPSFFWISPDSSLIGTQTRLADLLPKVSAYWHILQGRALFHSAGILHDGRVFLFAGNSGAGKSTVSGFSVALGHQVLHDDHVVAYENGIGQWLISNTLHSLEGAPLAAIFFLVQDTVDRLIPITKTTAAARLLDSMREHGKFILYGETLKKAFSTTARIARQVPAFELHFRKSGDFWKIIRERF